MADVLIKRRNGETLESFVSSLQARIGCNRWELRESSNYPDGQYFLCEALCQNITVHTNDLQGLDEFDFQMHFRRTGFSRKDEILEGLADCIARQLASEGYEVVYSDNIGKIGAVGVKYTLDIAAGSLPWERVRAEDWSDRKT
jgi:hypothetical protein